MTCTTPQGEPPAQAPPQRFSASVSGLPSHTRSGSGGAGGGAGGGRHSFSRSANGFRHSQVRATQPAYSLITGESSRTPPGRSGPSRADTPLNRASSLESLKENMAPPDAEAYEAQRRRIEELRAEVGTLSYRIETAKQEMEMAEARQAAELEDQRRRADDEYERAKASDMERQRAERSAAQAREDVAALRERLDQETQRLEKRAREADEENRLLREQMEELAVAKDDIARNADREAMDKSIKVGAARRAAEELEAERGEREALIAKMQHELMERDSRIGHLEAENIRLKAQAGDADTMAIVRRELSGQVAHIRALEASNRDQAAELKVLRQKAKRSDIAEEEKRSLVRKVESLSRTADDLAEARIQRLRLEDERMEWESHLRNAGDEELEALNRPEDVVRKLVEERLGRAQEVERAGSLRATIAEFETKLRSLQDERTRLRAEIETLKPSGASSPGAGVGAAPDKARARLERQRALAVKEVEYLRLQLSSFDSEDSTFQPEAHDAARSERIKELESLVDQYKAEVHSLHSDQTAIEDAAMGFNAKPGNKRPRTQDPTQETQESSHASPSKLRKLEDETSELRAQLVLAQKGLVSTQSQLAALRQRNKSRILALRDNPTSAHEAIKQTALNALRRENADLLSQLLSLASGNASSSHNPPTPLIPQSVLDATLLTVQATQQQVASAEKTTRRLKEVWSAKSAEFREAIASTLGWSVSFMPNGKMRVESMFYPSQTDEHENAILFDGERGTMKVGGGPRSPFADKIGGHIKFWVRERGCIPGLLAALTLEFYEEGIVREV